MSQGSARAASFGGPGFRPRRGTHLDDVRCGLWAPMGVQCEAGRLRDVLLASPRGEVCVEDPDSALMLQRVDVDRLRSQARALALHYRANGVAVHWVDPVRRPRPNWIFLRDLFVMTPEGAILARTASEQRAGEERTVAVALAELGVPLLGVPRGDALLEGADVLWAGPRTILVGLGRRTNKAGAAHVRMLVASLGVEVVEVEVEDHAQHLLGTVNFIDGRLAAVLSEGTGPSLRLVLRDLGVECIELERDTALRARSLNFVTLAPRHVLMPAGDPSGRARLERCGVRCDEIDVSEYVCAAGAMGCATGILRRDPLVDP